MTTRAQVLWGAVLSGGGALAATGVLAVHGPHVPGVACPSRALTGLDCPGCGATRCVAALLDGDIATAFDHHLLVPVLLPLLAWTWVAWVANGLAGREWRTLLHRDGAAIVALVVTIGFAVARNVPGLAGGFLGSGAG